jgi:hypothetical protein
VVGRAAGGGGALLFWSTAGTARGLLIVWYIVCRVARMWWCRVREAAGGRCYESLANSTGRQLIVRTDAFAMFVMVLMLPWLH